MDHTGGTEALRVAAPEWSLAGDRQLLGLLQNIHQKILSRCQETNSKLEEMVSALDNASVSLQNVNNRFMALSNSQFIESRVYDDDTDVTTETPVAKPEPTPITDSILPSLELGLTTIKRLHSPAEILQDSDSSTDDDDVLGTILVPKNMYSDRRLPYIIGTNNWRSQRHAGLISDASDSNTSEDEAMEQYSNSDAEDRQSHKAGIAISTSSSEHTSPATPQTEPVLPVPTPPRSQSDVAAELARRLGRGAIPEPQSTTEDHIEPVMPRKLYKPTPNAGTIFSDEPPPLLQDSSETDSEPCDDDDVFAEINRKAPYDSGRKVQSGLDSGVCKVPEPATQQSTLFGEEEDSDLFGDKPPSVQPEKQNDTRNIKKPIGAISLFGTNQGADTIGAAILRRNLNKSTSSEDSNRDDTDSTPTVNHSASGDIKNNVIKNSGVNNKDNVIKKVIANDRNTDVEVKVEKTTERPKERDIFDDLFAKSSINNKAKVVKSDTNKKVETPAKVNVFSDNIFDDIDDIFASEAIVKDVGKKVEKSYVFDDVDDLFSEVTADKVVTKVVKSSKVFDSDDDLFSDKPTENKPVPKTNKAENDSVIVRNVSEVKSKENIEVQSKKIEIAVDNNKIGDEIKSSRSIFDSDDDELFSDNPVKAKTDTSQVNKYLSVNTLKTESEALFDADDDIFAALKPVTKETAPKIDTVKDEICSNTNQFKEDNKENNNAVTKDDSNDEIKSDEWSDGDDSQKDTKIADNFKVLRETKIGAVKSPSLFSDDDGDYFNRKPKDSVFDHVEEISKNVPAKVSENSNFDSVRHNEVFDERSRIESSHLNDTNINNEAIPHKEIKSDNNIYSDNSFEDNNTETHDNNIKTSKEFSDDPITEEKEIFTPKNQESTLQNTNTVLDNTQTNLDNNKNIENNTLFPEQEAPKSNEVDIFDDIFADQPPAFEKPKEKKKSQNINALFDDDSDDEALFLRKTDNFTDELPDELPVMPEPVFTLFHDEPPALDADIAKTVNIPEPSTEKLVEKVIDKTDGVAPRKTEEIPKPVGKLKPLNFNINVNTLLPSASPKKVVKITAPIDSTPSSPDLSNDFEESESKMVKSVSFDGNPESSVLDNKLSKERAKIQVKRRPSTRRARKEAVRKSAIDFDTTDGGKSNDDGNTDVGNNDFGKSDFDTPKDTTEDTIVKISKESSDVPSKDINTKHLSVTTDNKTQILNINDDDIYIFRDPNIKSTAEVITGEKQEPIISTLGKVYETKDKVKKLNIIDDRDDGDDFFRDLGAKEANKQEMVPKEKLTQQKTYKSLFDDMSDEENLFGEAKGSKNYINDSDEELFASGSRIKKSTVIPKTVKKSLFDDDDALFGEAKASVKATPQSQPKQTSRQETASKSVQPVFADPLSLFGSDDES